MASIKYSPIGGELKGKIGGIAFQGGKSGPVVRGLLKRSFVRIFALLYGFLGTTFTFEGAQALDPGATACLVYQDGSHVAINNRKSRQNMLTELSAGWRDLTLEAQTAWNAAAVNFPFRNRFGDLYTASGFQVYMSLNLNLMTINQPINTFPPAPGQPEMPNVEMSNTVDIDPLQATFPDGIPTNVLIVVKSAVGQSQGRFIHSKNLKQIAVIGPYDTAVTINLRYMWQLFFGLVRPNTRIDLVFTAIDINTGSQSADMTKAEMIDAIAAGSKMTKADAGRAFPDTDTGLTNVATFDLSGFNIVGHINVALTGANADQFLASFDTSGVDPLVHSKATDQYGNLVPTVLLVTFAPTTIGAKTATITYTDDNGTVLGTSLLTGTGV